MTAATAGAAICPTFFAINLGTLDTYEDDDWRRADREGQYVTGLVLAVDDKSATIKIGPYRAILSPADFAWTGRKKASRPSEARRPRAIFYPGTAEATARVQLEQQPGPQAAMIAIDNPTGEIKAMVGGYSFEDSKFNRATQAFRQVGSSFKIYVYADALEKGSTPFDTILDAPFTIISGGQPYSPRNYDEKFEGNITLRRALAGSRNVPAVKLAEKIGISSVVECHSPFRHHHFAAALSSARAWLRRHAPARTRFRVHRFPQRRHPHRPAYDSPRHQLRWRSSRRSASRSSRRRFSRSGSHHDRHA